MNLLFLLIIASLVAYVAMTSRQHRRDREGLRSTAISTALTATEGLARLLWRGAPAAGAGVLCAWLFSRYMGWIASHSLYRSAHFGPGDELIDVGSAIVGVAVAIAVLGATRPKSR